MVLEIGNIYSETISQNQNIINLSLQPKITRLKENWFLVETAVAIKNITPEQAKEQAILKACKNVIEFENGTEISSSSLNIHSESNQDVLLDNFSKITNQISKGIVLKKELLEEKTKVFGNQIYKIVKVKLQIGKQKGERDPYFNISAKLNQDYFKEGDCLELKVRSSKDCYLTIFNITSDKNVITIFPNKYRKNNFIKAREKFSLPNDYEKSIGLKYTMGLLPGKEKDTEMVKIIATKKPANFILNENYKDALESLYKWLLQFPESEIEETDLQYYIYK